MKKIVQNTLLAAVAVLTASSCRHQDTPTEMAPATQRTIVQDATAICADTCPWTDSTIAVTKLTSEPIGRVVGSKHVTTDGTDTITSENVALLIDSGAVSNDVEISIVATTAEHSGVIPAHMENLTANGAVYRMLPDGQRFEKDITIAMRYDSTALPYGYTPDDIYTFFYNEQTRMWQQVERDSVDIQNQIVYSRTNHFTDYINGVLKVPENSDAMAYTPTSIKDLKAADPMEGITLIAPPEANNMGTANLTYPLNIPAGRRGMQPQLAITYNSAGGSGILGLGWSLPISEISVETRWGVPLYDSLFETEAYLLDGTTLVTSYVNENHLFLNKPVYRSSYEYRSNQDTLRFYPRVEGAFRKIERIGTSPINYYWIVTDKDGTRHFYGQTSQATLRDHKRNIAKWMLEKTVDTYGNSVTYSYTTKTDASGNQSLGKQLCIRKIQYTGVDGTNDHGQYIVRFYYSDKPDKNNSFRYGLEEINNYLLDRVEVRFRDTIIREYYFGYQTGAFGKTLLCKIFEGYDDSARCQLYDSSGVSKTLRDFSPLYRCDASRHFIGDSVYVHLSHTFEYYDCKALFLDDVTMDHRGNNSINIFNKYDSTIVENTCIGGSQSYGWNIGGGVNLGCDNIPWLKTFSVGGHYSYSRDYSEGIAQLVDINGDGYPDKLFRNEPGKIMCRPQIPGQNAFDEPVRIKHLDKFQYTSSSTQNYGWEASAAVAGVGKSWSDGRSNTSVYVSDVNGDGLIDIVDNGSVYINRGNYHFDDVTNNDNIQIASSCSDNAIDFSGEVDTSIFNNGYYTVERVVCTTIEEPELVWDTVYNENNTFTVIKQGEAEARYRDSCWTVYDTFYYNYPQRYEPDVDLVRMWKVPYDGSIAITGDAKLTDNLSGFRSKTRTYDGVRLAIQARDTVYLDSLLLPGEQKNMYCLILGIKKGDSIFFRINARDKRLYDQVEWTPHIQYLTAIHSNGASFLSSKVDANGDSVYRFDYEKDYMLTENQYVAVGPVGTSLTCINNFSVSCSVYFRPGTSLSQDMRLYLIIKNIDNSGTELTIDSAFFSQGSTSSSNTTVHFSASSVLSNQKLILRLAPVGGGQLNWSDIESDATVTLTHSTNDTINNRLSDTNANGAYVYHPAVERAFYDYLVFPSEQISGVSGSPSLYISVATNSPGLSDSILFLTIKDLNKTVCFKKKIKIDNYGHATVNLTPFVFYANRIYYIDFHTSNISFANQLSSIKYSIGSLIDKNAGLYAKYSPDIEKHHGTLYRGWGQFGYKSPDSTFSKIRSNLIQANNNFIAGESNQAPLESQINAIDVSTLDADSDPEETPGGLMLNPLSGVFFEMHADAKNRRWTSFSNLVTASRTLSSLDNSDPAKDSIDMFQSPLPIIKLSTKIKAVNKMTLSKGNSSTRLMVSLGKGYSRLLGDFMDLNGDRYPDNVSEKVIQYSRAQGGLGDIVRGYSGSTSRGINRTINSSTGFSFNGTFLNMALENAPNAKKSRAVLTVSGLLQLVNGSLSEGDDTTQITFMDINGDGLADIVYNDDKVRYNMGYMFTTLRDRPTSHIRSSNSNADAVGFGFNVVNSSITGGVSSNTSSNQTEFALMDVNGDGLPDKVSPNYVRFNTGNGYTNPVQFTQMDHSSSTSFSLNISATYDYVIFPFLKVGGSIGGGGSVSFSRSGGEFTDINNDGYVDYVYQSGNHVMVRYSNIGRANLLKSVTNFSGASFDLDYKLDSSTVQSPQRHWVLDSLVVYDGHIGDGENKIYKRFAYWNRNYDRFERDDYGYDTVKTYDYEIQENLNSAPTITLYRTSTQVYYNDNYYHAHLKKSECVSKGNKYVKTQYTYNDANLLDGQYSNLAEPECERYTWPALKAERSYYCESSANIISTKREYNYGPYGNVTQVLEYGDSVDATDNYTVNMSYAINPSRYIVANVSEINIPGYRNRQAIYNANGSIIRLTVDNYPSPQSVYQYEYDRYGNDSIVTTPALNYGTNNHYWIRYFYDQLTHSFPTMVFNAEGHTSHTQYSLRWQKPTNTIDISGNRMHYAYDSHGRIDTIVAPKEIGNGIPYTVKYDYWYNQKHRTSGMDFYREIMYSWARTRNYDPANPGNDINTVTFSDGLGRIIQVKKDIDEEGVERRVVGGTIHYDGLGRKTREYFPISESLSLADSILNNTVTHDVYYTETQYDYLDRPVQIFYADGTSLANSYSIAPDSNNINRFLNTVTDQNSHSSNIYTDPRQLNIQFKDALGNTTIFHYDAIGQLLSSEDPEHNTTTYVYDRGGRCTSRVHPSSGNTLWSYDAAGNVIRQTPNSGEYIEYRYDYTRPVFIKYTNHPWNNVWYEYGTAGIGNNAGRLIKQQDASGVQTFDYDNMGNMIYNTHTYVQPHSTNTFTLETQWTYDSWGRVNSIIYPDFEEVTYSYDHGGNVKHIEGRKYGQSPTVYIDIIHYDRFGQRTYQITGDSVRTYYGYNSITRRLHSLIDTSIHNSQSLQKNFYTYDNVGNITEINDYGLNLRNQSFEYDNINRLVYSEGYWQDPTLNYTSSYRYSAAGRLTNKQVSSQRLKYSPAFPITVNYKNTCSYSSTGNVFAVNTIQDDISGSITYLGWDANGNLRQTRCTIPIYERHLCWTEDNRLQGYTEGSDENGDISAWYNYNANGERNFKITSPNIRVRQNGRKLRYSANLVYPTLYASALITLSRNGYTKHYFDGANRICSKIGGGFSNANWYSITTPIPKLELEYDEQTSNQTDCILNTFERCLELYVDINVVVDLYSVISHEYMCNDFEPSFYYHSDHLGSAAYLTDDAGQVMQTLNYLPYGEDWVELHDIYTFDSIRLGMYRFNGKEKDWESGFHYYGARYYWSELLTGWLSVDPMMDKYPSISPYAYCTWNPVKLVDPDGNFPATTHANIVWKASAGLGISIANRIKMCYGTSFQSDIIHWKRTSVHLDGYNQYGPNKPTDLQSAYNNAINDYSKFISIGDYANAGEALHTISDFYSHSNYIELYAEYAEANNLPSDIRDIPTFSEAQKDEKLMSFLKGKLKTGIFPDDKKNLENSHKGMTKDSKRKGNGGTQYMNTIHTMYDAAKETALKETHHVMEGEK